MENKIQTGTTAHTTADQKTTQNPEVQKLFKELNDKTGKGISLRECEMLLLKPKRLSEKFNDPLILETAVTIVGKKLIRIGADREAVRNVRVRSLENALKLLFDFYGKRKIETSGGLNPAVLLLIARACYVRSALILSRHDKVMLEKKKRIIEMGIKFIDEFKEVVSRDKDALRLHCILLLELEKIDKDDIEVSELETVLDSAIKNGCEEFNEKAEDIEISLRFAEFAKKNGGNKPLPENVIKSLKTIVKSSLHAESIELKKAKAHLLLGNDMDVITCMKAFTRQLVSLELPFSDPLWSEAAEFVRKIKEDRSGKDYWKELALLIWKACKDQEGRSSSLHLLWYWGHLVTQYFIADLAFLAVDTVKEKAEIADFVKSRLQFHAQALESEVGKFYDLRWMDLSRPFITIL